MKKIIKMCDDLVLHVNMHWHNNNDVHPRTLLSRTGLQISMHAHFEALLTQLYCGVWIFYSPVRMPFVLLQIHWETFWSPGMVPSCMTMPPWVICFPRSAEIKLDGTTPIADDIRYSLASCSAELSETGEMVKVSPISWVQSHPQMFTDRAEALAYPQAIWPMHKFAMMMMMNWIFFLNFEFYCLLLLDQLRHKWKASKTST